MWKDFFYYSKAERRIIVFLLLLALILTGVYIGISRKDSPVVAMQNNEEIDSFYNRKIELCKIAKQNVNFHRFSEKTKCEFKPFLETFKKKVIFAIHKYKKKVRTKI